MLKEGVVTKKAVPKSPREEAKRERWLAAGQARDYIKRKMNFRERDQNEEIER